MEYVPSHYNCFFEKDGKGCGYNFLYRSIIELSPTILDQVREALSDSSGLLASKLPLDWQAALTDGVFLIPSGRIELAIIKMRYYKQLFATDVASLIILPTLFCNFSCPYCFELKKPGIMTIEVTDAIVAWVMRAFPKKRRLQVSWFGGEPLLAKGVISRLSDSLISVCREWNAEYIAYMTTNGYYLDQEVIDNIPSWALRSVQVTLDGDRDHHDSLRRQRQGGGSFDCIAENIERFCEVPHECNLTIRVNCTDDNYSSTFKLLERFGSNVRRRARIFFRWVWPSEVAGYLDLAPIGRNIDPYRRLHALYRAANVSGWLTSIAATDFSDGYCEVDYPDHFNVDPFGNLYLCSHKFDAAEAVGSVFQAGFGLNEDKIDYYAKWYTTDPFSDIECCKCRLLPICWGGCRKSRIEGKRACINENEAVELFAEEIVRNQIFSKTLSQKDIPKPDVGCSRRNSDT